MRISDWSSDLCSSDLLGNRVDLNGVDQGFVALYVHYYAVWCESKLQGYFGQSVGAGGVVGASQDGVESVRLYSGLDMAVVGGNDNTAGLRLSRLLGGADHHGLAADVEQRLSRQPCRRGTGRNDGDEANAASVALLGWSGFGSTRSRASASSMTGMPSRMGKASRSEEHTSELQSLMRISYAVFCFQKKRN